MEGQLERFYAHDPEAKGFGIYCVFWFGAKRPRTILTRRRDSLRLNQRLKWEQMLKDMLREI